MASAGRVLLLRAPREDCEHDPYKQVFSESSIDATSISPLHFDFMNLESLQAHLSCPSDFSGLVFSSARTVQAVERCRDRFPSPEDWQQCLQDGWVKLPAYTVGTATALAARELGLMPLGEETGNAANLVRLIKDGIPARGKPLLIPRGELAREELTKGLDEAGINYKVNTVYQTVCSPELEQNLQSYFAAASPDVIAFFSPSGVRFSASILYRLANADSIKFVSIGPTTTTAMEEAGYKVAATAAKPNPQTLLKTTLELLDKVP